MSGVSNFQRTNSTGYTNPAFENVDVYIDPESKSYAFPAASARIRNSFHEDPVTIDLGLNDIVDKSSSRRARSMASALLGGTLMTAITGIGLSLIFPVTFPFVVGAVAVTGVAAIGQAVKARFTKD